MKRAIAAKTTSGVRRRIRRRMTCSCGTAAVALLLVQPALAQEADSPPPPQPASPSSGDAGGDIVVTGSHIVRDGFQVPTPVSVVTADEINQAAPVTVADFVNQLPALSGSVTPKSNNGGITSGFPGGNFLNLRALGVPRTLVLLNGRRVAPSSTSSGVDINTLPTSLVSRVDVVTGGASAAYGSDAVAGVVNFVLDTGFTGLKGSIQNGITSRGDARSLTADLSYGASFADGRAHLLLSGNYSDQKVAHARSRDWFKAYKVVTNPAYADGNGQPRRLMLPWSSLVVTDEGLIASGPLKGYAFDAAGQVRTTNFLFPPVVSSVYGGGSKAAYRQLDDISRDYPVSLPLEQWSVFARLGFDVTDRLKVFAEGSYGDSTAVNPSVSGFRTGNAALQIDNFYLPQQVRDAMADAGVTSIPLSTSNRKLGNLTGVFKRTSKRALGGVEGKFGSSWSYGLSYQYGEAHIESAVRNNLIVPNYNRAIDVIDNPLMPGTPICRSTLADPDNGCVPLNPLGSLAPTAQQLAYVTGTSRQDLKLEQQVAEFFLNGDLLDLPAGSLAIAMGGQYRREQAVADADAVSAQSAFFGGNFSPFSGRYTVKEAFGEIAVPVLKDSAVGAELSLNAAGRLIDYSTSGTVFTWKLGGLYKPVDDLTLRVTRSRDIRAPNLFELFNSALFVTQNVSDPFSGGANAIFQQVTAGNPALQPEKADALTVGAIYSPSWFPGFQLSVDYYEIKIRDAIATSSSQQVVNRCFAGEQIFCSAIQRDSAGSIVRIDLIPFNALSEIARGLDIEASYATSVGGGRLGLRALVNYVDKLDIISPGSIVSRAGEVGNNVGSAQGVPRIRGLVTATYEIDGFLMQLKGRFIGKSKVEASYGPLDIDINKVPAIFYTDLYAGYTIPVAGGETELFLAVDNLFDTNPPPSQNQDNANGLASGVSVGIYDVLGRAFRVGARFKF